jgi:mono/diheme cytochrome c family protein
MDRGSIIVFAGLVGMATLITLAGWLAADREDPPQQQVFDREMAGAYVKAGCWQCHSVSTLRDELVKSFGAPAGGELPVGPDLAGIARLYHSDWHEAHLWDPQAVVAGSQMPAQRFLFEETADGPRLNALGVKVTEFLMTLDAPSQIRAPWPTGEHETPSGNAARGRSLFPHYCAGCHGETGHGDGTAARWFKHTRPPAKLAQGEAYHASVFDTLTNGLPGTGMPSFHHLPSQDRADLAAYASELLGR